MLTIVASVVIPNGTDPKPVATIVLANGEVQRHTLHDHDWSYDWDRNGRAPASLYRILSRIMGGHMPHGDRLAYQTTHWNGESNEKGRLTVWEIEYDG